LRYSPQNKLLCVRVAAPGRAAGTVEVLDSALFVGYLDKFSTVDISVDLWLRLCRAVAERLDA
jgi:hypothetical protein